MHSSYFILLVGLLLGICGCAPGGASHSEGYLHAVAKLTHNESPTRDEELCRAILTVLDDLAAAGDPSVYVVFTDEADADGATDATRDLGEWQEDFEFHGQELPILSQDVVFAQDAAGRRQKQLVEEMQGALRTVADDCLLKLVPLEPGATRSGKIILDIHTTYHHGNTFVKVHFARTPYLLREFSIDWEAKLINREGNALVAVKTRAYSGRRVTQEAGRGCQHEDPAGRLRHLGDVASWLQLESAYADLRSLLEKKLGTSSKQESPN
jgi:hypothetical protein